MNRLLLDRRYWLVPLAVWTAVVLASLAWNLSVIEREIAAFSTTQAREVFRMMESVRAWNAGHGGVYVVQDERTPPNPYLEGVEREVETRDGRRLTLVNPAYMTRQIAESVGEHTGMRVHITSLKTLNPGNAADDWERAALLAFESGDRERAEVLELAGRRTIRYMAPLYTRQACLECHARQGYRVGDVRGGISVSFPIEHIVAARGAQARSVLAVHLVGWLLVAALTVLALSRSRLQLLALADAKREQEALVEQRTAELRREVAERRHAETRLRLLIDASGNGIFGLGAGGECSFINPVALRLLGVARAEDLLGQPLLERIAPLGAHLGMLQDALRLGRSVHSDEVVFRRSDGTTFDAEVRLDPIDAEAGGGVVVNFADVSRRKAAEASVWHQANHDPLTGLANRGLLRERLADTVLQARRSREIIGLLFIDLDGFKAINDTHGHDAGDAVLREVAQRLQGGIRESDFAARLAGDEFVVVLRHLAGEDYAGAVAGKLLAALSEPVRHGEGELAVSASIGIALHPHDANAADELLRQADAAMYKAKEAGKRVYRYYAGGRFTGSWASTT